MVKPVSVFAYLAVEPFRKLPQMINELSVKVLNTPLNFALILRIRRMSKLSFNAMFTGTSLSIVL